MKKENFFLEVLLFYILFAAAIYFVYLKPSLALPYFLLLLIWCLFSKKNYFWFAFFFIILQTPGWFFADFTSSRLPLITILPGISFSPIDLFTILMVCKSFFNQRSRGINSINIRLRAPLVLLLIYFLFSFWYGLIIHNGSLKTAAIFLRPVAYFTWILSFVSLVSTKDDIFKFLKLLLPVSFFIFFTQIYFLIKGSELITLFDPDARTEIATNTLTGELRPYMGGIPLLVINYITALISINLKQKVSNRLYVYAIVSVIFLSVFISATRFLFGIILFISIGVFINKIKNLPKVFLIFAAITLLITIFIKLDILKEDYLRESAWARVAQIFQGKPGEIDTLQSRLEQLKVMIDKINESLLFGYGFSDVSLEYYNNNWGFWNTILIFGLFGFLLYLFLMYSYFIMMRKALSGIQKGSDSYEGIRIFLIGFCALVIAYFFTWDVFSIFYPYMVAFDMIFLAISGSFIRFAQLDDTISLRL